MKAVSGGAYLPQLDGLRAFAIFAVAVSHWTPNFLVGIVPWGTGVQLFFVLSGFLITGILLRNRPEDLGITMTQALKVFYIRRFLRIFPLYYGVLAFALLLGVGPIYSTWPWHVSYLSNLHYAWHGHADAVTDPFLHLWSLSVEEQFYLLWPLVALVASRRALAVVLYASILGAVIFRLTVAETAPDLVTRYLTPSNLDAFGVGGLIAHLNHYRGDGAVRILARRLAWIGVLGLVLTKGPLGLVVGAEPAHRVGHTLLVIVYGAIVAQATLGFPGPIGRLLQWKPVRYLGQISYGLYVYHYFAPAALHWLAPRFGWERLLQHPPSAITAYTLFTLILAVLSWHFYEWPINRLKRHFGYPGAATPGVAVRPETILPATRA